jgi:hypothetical protein
MKKMLSLAGMLLIAASLFMLKSCSNNKPGEVSTGADCFAPAFWFEGPSVPAPLEGAGSPFANPQTTTNCDFHRWSWQKFLFLTNTAANGKLNFENLVHVDNQMNQLGDTLILTDTTQAGSHATLLDKTNTPIYYSIYMNQQMFDFANKYVALFKKSGLNNDTLHSLGYDTLSYPVGCFEMKASWILASSIDPNQIGNYYVTAGKVNKVMTKVALIGMHIVGRVANHPEFIWATYEHLNLAPLAAWPANYQVDSIPDSTQVLSSNNFLFYTAGKKMNECTIRRPSGSAAPFQSTYMLYDHGTQVKYAGMTPQAMSKDSSNLANINCLNKGVHGFLEVKKSVWANYEYTGSLWIDPTVAQLQPGNGYIGSLNALNLRGSRAISNITMETFAQLYMNSSPTVPQNSMNCFGCHATNDYLAVDSVKCILSLSHLFNNRLNNQTESPKNK